MWLITEKPQAKEPLYNNELILKLKIAYINPKLY